MVLYVFVVAYVGNVEEPLGDAGGVVAQLGPLFALALLIELSIAVIGSSLGALDTQGAELGSGFGQPGQVGELLLSTFLIPFEAASFLLLVAAVGAVVLARRRRGLEGDEEEMPRRGMPPVGREDRPAAAGPDPALEGTTEPAPAGTAEGTGS
jgi:NADH-quinone oxidoreductase subunit J